MDIVYVRGLEVKTVIGVYDWEREIKQPVTVDLDMACDIARAAATDDHHHVLDYKVVCVRVTEFIEKSKLQLLEAMAEDFRAHATSLASELGRPVPRAAFTRRLFESLESALDVHADQGFEALRPRFERRFRMAGAQVTVDELAGHRLEGRALDREAGERVLDDAVGDLGLGDLLAQLRVLADRHPLEVDQEGVRGLREVLLELIEIVDLLLA